MSFEPILVLESTHVFPSVTLNSVTGVLSISGRCMPENPTKYFATIKEWMTEYFKNPQPETEFNINLDYFNSSSSTQIFNLFLLLENYHVETETNVKVVWTYDVEDDDMVDFAEKQKGKLKIPVELIGAED
ncbi:MAG: hypothetical protein ACI9J3_001669 [Parvicellaceae bacterium]|jgi:hypothetical protein